MKQAFRKWLRAIAYPQPVPMRRQLMEKRLAHNGLRWRYYEDVPAEPTRRQRLARWLLTW